MNFALSAAAGEAGPFGRFAQGRLLFFFGFVSIGFVFLLFFFLFFSCPLFSYPILSYPILGITTEPGVFRTFLPKLPQRITAVLPKALPVFHQVHAVFGGLGGVAARLRNPQLPGQLRIGQRLKPVRAQGVVNPPVPEDYDAAEFEDQPGFRQRPEIAALRPGHAQNLAGTGAEAVVVTADAQLVVEQSGRRRQVEKPVAIHDRL